MYPYLKLLHLIAVILFMGNIYTGIFWMHYAAKTKDVGIIVHTIKGVIRSDRFFTIPGVILITAFGIFAAVVGQLPLLRTGWILWSIILFSISGIAFMVKVAPLQRKLLQLTENNEAKGFDWQVFNKVFHAWDLWGLIALLTPAIAMVLMILKWPQ